MPIPTSIAFEGKDVPLYTFGQLEQQPRLKLKGRAMDLRDLVGADRLPALRAAAGADEVLPWIIEVQCALAKAAGIDLNPAMLGMPKNFGFADDDMINQGQQDKHGGMAGQPMEVPHGIDPDSARATNNAAAALKAKNQRGSDIFGGYEEAAQQPAARRGMPGPDAARAYGNPYEANYESAMDTAAALKAKNQRGSNIFGGDDAPQGRGGMPPRQPMQEMNAPPGGGVGRLPGATAAYETAMDQAAATRARNQRGSNIFG